MRRLGKRRRRKVVELLRCGADGSSLVWAGHGTGHYDGVEPCSRIFTLVWLAYDAVKTEDAFAHRAELLEAVLRVEIGEWP